MCAYNLEELQDPGSVVGNTDLGRGDCQAGVVGTYYNITNKGNVTCASPDTSFGHGNNGCRKFHDAPDHSLKRIIIGQGITSITGQLFDIKTGRPYLRPFISPEDHHPGL